MKKLNFLELQKTYIKVAREINENNHIPKRKKIVVKGKVALSLINGSYGG